MYTRQMLLENPLTTFWTLWEKVATMVFGKEILRSLISFAILFKVLHKRLKTLAFFINKCFQCREISIIEDDPCSLSEAHEFWVYETQYGYYNRTNTNIWSTVPDRIGWFVFVQILVIMSILFITTQERYFRGIYSLALIFILCQAKIQNITS